MNLSDREWKEFKVEEIFEVFNSKPYHKKNLTSIKSYNEEYIPYITRTNRNNGLEDIVENKKEFKINPKNIIVFGAENATFFYQPFEHITGNKMYGIKNNIRNKYIGLFIQQVFNTSINGCGFSYGQGLTGKREKRRSIMLPVKKDNDKEPDWTFMERYVDNILNEKNIKYQEYIKPILSCLKYEKIPKLEEKKWNEFFLVDLFPLIQRGKRIVKSKQIEGLKPYISSTSMNNGVDNYISNDKNVRIFKDCLTIANSGSVGSSFYQPFEFVASDHVTHLKNNKMNKYIYLFIATLTNRFSEKYNFNREINDKRISREKIMLPVNDNNEVDYEYMEQYIKNIMIEKYKKYCKYLT
ncbi:restriction endonuclease subunit S [Clostridium perfringens]|uniref:restriction endonuclease subunit S n=1 Tax=Clostridium perfringens TaxID=1502 RepID=UPI0039EBCF5D